MNTRALIFILIGLLVLSGIWTVHSASSADGIDGSLPWAAGITYLVFWIALITVKCLTKKNHE